jgi:hypothetical protein
LPFAALGFFTRHPSAARAGANLQIQQKSTLDFLEIGEIDS